MTEEGVLFNHAFTNNPKCKQPQMQPLASQTADREETWQLEQAMRHFGVFPAERPAYPDLFEQAGCLVGFMRASTTRATSRSS